MAAPVVANPSVANRSDSKWWTAPIGVGAVGTNAVFLSDLPTADPLVAGQLWVDATTHVVTESQG